jgi:hypothetical protein
VFLSTAAPEKKLQQQQEPPLEHISLPAASLASDEAAHVAHASTRCCAGNHQPPSNAAPYYVMTNVTVTRSHRYMFVCVACGLWGGLAIGLQTEYFTSNRYRPVQVGAGGCVRMSNGVHVVQQAGKGWAGGAGGRGSCSCGAALLASCLARSSP